MTRRPEEEEVYFNYGTDSVGEGVKDRLGFRRRGVCERNKEVETGALGEPCLS